MRICLILCVFSLMTPLAYADKALVGAAQDRLKASVRYDPAYVGLSYPGGDVPADTGVCSDVIIRTYRAAYGFDFQKALHEDMKVNKTDFKPGDIVTWRLGGALPHIGIVSDRKSSDGTPLIIHNIGAGPKEDNILFQYKIQGHYRFIPASV